MGTAFSGGMGRAGRGSLNMSQRPLNIVDVNASDVGGGARPPSWVSEAAVSGTALAR